MTPAREAKGEDQEQQHHSNNMLDRITDDLNFLLNGTTEDMMTFTPAHLYQGAGGTGGGCSGGKQKLPTIQENMVGISEEFERTLDNTNDSKVEQ